MTPLSIEKQQITAGVPGGLPVVKLFTRDPISLAPRSVARCDTHWPHPLKRYEVEPLRILFMENYTITRALLHWGTALLVVLLLGSPLPAQVRVTPSVVPRVASSAADSSGFWLYFA